MDLEASQGTGVLVAAPQTVFTLDHGPVAAAKLPSLGSSFTVLSYDGTLFRYAAVQATAEAGPERATLAVDAGAARFTLVAEQALKLSEGDEVTAGELAAGQRLFGVTVDRDGEGDPRIHLRNGLRGKAKLAALPGLPARPEEGARTPAGIKSDLAIAAVETGEPGACVVVRTRGPRNLVIWPGAEPVGFGVLLGV